MDVVILDPTLKSRGDIKPATRLLSLEGRTIGFLDNSKEKADAFLAAVATALTEQFGARTLVRRKPTYSRVAPAALIGELRESCDGVVTAMGA